LKPQRDPVDIHIGARLRRLRVSRHVSLEEVGRMIGVTYQQIQKYETGANRISAATLFRIAAAFSVAPAFFFEGLPAGDGDGVTGDDELATGAVSLDGIADQDVREKLRALIVSLDEGRSR
jgi:transcriptional regulator with XRE-family HTH domain